MSNMPLIPTLVGVIAGAIGVAGYHKASTLQDEIHKPKAAVVDKSADEALARELHRLEARVTALELRPAPREAGPTPSAAPSPPPADPSAAEPEPPEEPGPRDPKHTEDRKRKVGEYIGTYWKDWGAKHGLSTPQSQALADAQSAAAVRRVDNQNKLADHTITQAQGRADNQAAVEEVRRKAQSLMTADQLTQFEAERGAEWGSSYKRIHELVTQSKAAPPSP